MSWDERIARARSLADGSPASQILTFYAALAVFQRGMVTSTHVHPTEGVDLHTAVEMAARAVPDFLGWLERHAPSALAQAAAERAGLPADEWTSLLAQRIEDGRLEDDGPAAFVVEAALQPFVERAAHGRLKPGSPNPAKATCPVCDSLPVVAALRETGQGARRTLVCSLCFTEWDYLRIQCPVCEENRFDALPVYTADAPASVRIDACDSCRTYIKTIDLTRDGLAVPTVDDLASVPMDLWARERGYRRLYPNLLRL